MKEKRIESMDSINTIDHKILKMAKITDEQIRNSLMVLRSGDTLDIEKVMEKEKIVDIYQKEIEEECIKFIATKQPLAKDLRRIFVTSKIVTDLERIADYAVDICKISKKIKKSVVDMELLMMPLWEMEEVASKMIQQSINAYIKNDVKSSYDICKLDDIIDDIYGLFFEDMIRRIIKDTVNSNSQAQLLFVAKYIERIGDHVTNICEWTIYANTGKYVDLNE